MDFEEHDDQDQDQDEEMEDIPTAPPGYDSSSTRPNPGGGGDGGASNTNARKSVIRYRECLKNHAVSIGGHAVDGCCEFMAAGEEGTLDALKCAACNCHRNFHRKECTDGGGGAASDHHNNYQLYHHAGHTYYRAPPPSGYLHLSSPHPRPLALPGVSGGGGHSREEGEDASIPSSSGGSGSKKRFRTKFTAEQKEKMLELAERVGWRIQKHDEAAVEQFCSETGLSRHVLKVWMHNNKHTLGKKP